MKRIPLHIRFFALKMLQYAITTCFSSFILAYLKSARDLSDSAASLMLMLNTLGAFAGQFVVGRLCDRLHTHKKMYYAMFVMLVPVALALYNVRSTALISMFYLLFGFAQIPFTVIIDTWFLDSFPGDTGTYGKMLASGAVAYAVLSVSYGKLLDTVGYWIMPWCLVSLIALACIAAWTIPDVSLSGAKKKISATGAD